VTLAPLTNTVLEIMVMVTGKMYRVAVMCLQNTKQEDGYNASFYFAKTIGQHHRERGTEKHTNCILYKKNELPSSALLMNTTN